jgi:predicted aldo/keto reductase-like oxidoreductase
MGRQAATSNKENAMRIDRREFLGKAMVGAGGAMLARDALAAARPSVKNFEPFETVDLGKTGIKVSRVGFGTGSTGGKRSSNQTRLGEDKCKQLVRTAYDKGIRLFDMADLYGSHFALAALKDLKRDSYAVVSKIWWRPGRAIPEPDRPDADVVVARFLKELGTDYIDVVQLHCVIEETWPTKVAKQMEILAKLKKKGTIRAHGVSVHGLAGLKTAAKEPWVDVIHSRINAYGQSMDDKDPTKVAAVLQEAHKNGKAVIGMKLIGNGNFRNDEVKKKVSLDYVLSLGCVDTMIVGFESGAEIDDYARRVRKVPRSIVGTKVI